MFFPPVNFGLVEEGLYRSALPNEINYPFLERLRLKTIIYLYPDDDIDAQLVNFLEDQDVTLISLGEDDDKRNKSWAPVGEETVLAALERIVDSAHYPVLITCNTGKHRTGTVVACLRKLQRWNLTSILEEYRRFTKHKVRVQNEQFIELFDTDLVHLPPEAPPFVNSDLAQQAPDVIGAAADLADLAGAASGLADVAGAASGLADVAGAAQASVGESLGSIGSFWGSIVDSVSSAKDQVTDTTLGSVGALKSQVGELGANALSPFQRLGEDLSSSLTGGLDSLKTGAQGAVTKNIGSPLEEGLGRIFSNFGTSPEELLKEEETWANGVQQVVTQIEGVATPSRVFYAENAFILPFWLGMIVWPEEKLTKQVISSYLPVVAAAVVYTWLTYECFQNPVSLQGFASGITNFPVLRQGFGEEVSVATAWSHFLAEDLFIGRFVYLDGQKNKVFTRHSLLLCYLFGPVGFLSHMLTRGAVGVVKPVRDIMEAGIGQQPTKVSPKSPPATKAASPISSPVPSTEAVELVAKAKREAEEILKEARSAGASLLEDAERDSLLILKGAEVEKEALLQSNKPETTAKIEGAATEAESDGAATKTKAKPAKTGPAAT